MTRFAQMEYLLVRNWEGWDAQEELSELTERYKTGNGPRLDDPKYQIVAIFNDMESCT